LIQSSLEEVKIKVFKKSMKFTLILILDNYGGVGGAGYQKVSFLDLFFFIN